MEMEILAVTDNEIYLVKYKGRYHCVNLNSEGRPMTSDYKETFSRFVDFEDITEVPEEHKVLLKQRLEKFDD